MEIVVSVVALLCLLFLVARGTPGSRLLMTAACVLALILVVVAVERSGWWPTSWRTR